MTGKSSVTEKRSMANSNLINSENQDISGFKEFVPYVNELRRVFWKVLFCFVLGAALGIIYYQSILSFILRLFQLEAINLVLTSPYQFINLSINVGFFLGVIFCLPVFTYYFLKFIKPALKDREFKLLIQMLPASAILFIIGFGLGVWILQYVVDLFSQTSSSFNVGNIWDLSNFMGQIVIMGLSMAFVFQMPIAITILLRLKIVSHQTIAKKRKIIYAGLLIFAALLPPTDPIALGLLTLIPLFLFEITLVLNKRITH